jgi:CubicO group peptidase (beta-lactamase class C family)
VRVKRGVGYGLLLFLFVLIVFAAVFGGRAAGILVAYKAKQVCSGVFVAGRDAAAVIDELEADDLELLRYVDASVNPAAKAVTASTLGLITRTAAYRGSTGCALVFGPSSSAPAVRTTVADDDAPVAEAESRLSDVLAQAFTEPDPARPRRTRAVVIVHDGRIVGERYAGDVDAETPLLGWSMTKSVTSALIGILVGEGKLSLDRPVPVGEWQSAGDPRRAITLDHLLRMSSGLHFDEDGIGPFSDVISMLLRERDMAAFAIDNPLDAAPGTRWQYSSGTSLILSRVMRNVIGNDADYAAFPRRALFDPLGMSSATIETDAAGTFVGSSLMYATARDWARFGTLYLQDGVWEGRRVLPEGWVKYSTTPAPADPGRRYGAHFWLQLADGYRASDAGLPADAFHATGHQGQFVTIVPSRRAVIVRLGMTRHPGAWDQAAFTRDVLAALDGAWGG